ncbi:MAG: 3-oxoacyl-ACP reductase FabG [Acidimicrobiales bacterium]|nr:3-oxoacyl-ACP reductase FabG [Acidimicrobiales bacterium]
MTESDLKVAVVTGGGSGIGEAIAHRLCDDGMAIGVLDLDEAAAQRVAAGLRDAGHDAIGVHVDVSDRAAVEAGFGTVRAELGPVSVLVNNAGRDGFRRFVNITEDEWNAIIAVNLTGTFHCTQVGISDMIEAGWGRVINISSSSAQGGQEFMAHYVSSKAGMIGLTKSLAKELGQDGITVNTVPPGFIDTPMLRRSEAKGLLGGSVEDHEERTPVRRVGTGADIANAVAFLASEASGYITGQIIGVNGGRNT